MPRQIKPGGNAPLQPTATVNDFKDRLVKLIPSEIVTAYVTIQGLLTGSNSPNGNKELLLWIVIAILVLLTPVHLYFVGKVRKWGQLLFTTIAFVLWVIAIGSPFKEIIGFEPTFIGSIFLGLYTLLIPFFYKG